MQVHGCRVWMSGTCDNRVQVFTLQCEKCSVQSEKHGSKKYGDKEQVAFLHMDRNIVIACVCVFLQIVSE